MKDAFSVGGQLVQAMTKEQQEGLQQLAQIQAYEGELIRQKAIRRHDVEVIRSMLMNLGPYRSKADTLTVNEIEIYVKKLQDG